MKVLIQESSTKQFFSGNGKWVASTEKAENFESFESARAFADEFLSGDVDIIYHDSRLGVNTPLRMGKPVNGLLSEKQLEAG